MKRKAILVVLLSGLTQFCFADVGDQYLLPKAGVISINVGDVDPLYSVGLMYGYGLEKRISAEAEVNYGFGGGQYSSAGNGSANEKGHYRVLTLAGYGVYRYPVTRVLYAKFKLGLLHEHLYRTIERVGVGDSQKTVVDTGLAGGFGAGYVFDDRSTGELEVTIIDQDILFLSVGWHYRF